MRTPLQKKPINCPYCDEPSYHKANSNRVVLPHKIYDLKECPMGHTFYTIEYAPEDQDEVEQEVQLIKKTRYKERLLPKEERTF